MTSTVVTTPICQLHFPRIFEPDEFHGKRTFSSGFLLDMTNSDHKEFFEDLDELWEGIDVPRGYEALPFFRQENKNTVLIKAKSGEDYPPTVFDAQCNPMSPIPLSAGRQGRGSLRIKAYKMAATKKVGLSIYLQQVQLISEGTGFDNTACSFDSVEGGYTTGQEEDDNAADL